MLSHTSPISKLAHVVTRHKFFVLFVYLLLALILYPNLINAGYGYLVFRVVGSAGILLTVYAISLRRSMLFAGLLLAVPAFLHRILLLEADAGLFPLLGIVFSFVFDVFVVVVIFRRVLPGSNLIRKRFSVRCAFTC